MKAGTQSASPVRHILIQKGEFDEESSRGGETGGG
jgi:hypothetical protein